MEYTPRTNLSQYIVRYLLGLFLLTAGIGHLTFLRTDFQAQVPHWLPFSKDFVVILSGVVEIALATLLIFWSSQARHIGMILALFFVLVFPGNIAQYINHADAFGLNTDSLRLIRLFFQPVLIFLALWSTGALQRTKGSLS